MKCECGNLAEPCAIYCAECNKKKLQKLIDRIMINEINIEPKKKPLTYTEATEPND